MDINCIRSLITVLSFTVFIGICVWAWSARHRTRFAEAANLAVEDEPMEKTTP